MAGFTLGGTDGATLGGGDGGTLGTENDEWLLEGEPLPEVIDEVATHRGVAFTFRASTQTLLDRLRKLKDDEDKVTVLVDDGGGYSSVERADGGNTFTLDPPERRRPLRRAGSAHVRSYEENLVSAEVGEWDVTVDFVHSGHRTDRPVITVDEQTTDDGIEVSFTVPGTLGTGSWWALSTRYDELRSSRVSADLVGTGEDGVERVELQATLSFEQAHMLEAALARLDGARVQSVPDAPNTPRDETADGGNTLTITPPDDTPENVISAGDHVVIGGTFESTRLNDAWQNVSFEVAPR